MSNPTTPPVPAGWHTDPEGTARLRWWDGSQWTDHYRPNPNSAPEVPSSSDARHTYKVLNTYQPDPYAYQLQPYSTTASDLHAPTDAPVYNLWIWLVVFVPYAGVPFLFMIDVAALARAAGVAAELDFGTTLGLAGLALAGVLGPILALVFGYFDWHALISAGIRKPFHWAFGFFGGYPVYAIGRSIVTMRRTGHGSAVLWVTIGMIVLGFFVVLAWLFWAVTQMSATGPSSF